MKEKKTNNILITGAAGFIGYHLQRSLTDFYQVQGIDSIVDDSTASKARAKNLSNIYQISIQDAFLSLIETPKVVIHLAASTGISQSLNNPDLYLDNNVRGTFNVLEQCRKNGVKYLIYASSSSVYEPRHSIMNEMSPHDNQLSFYGTSKHMMEIMVENYCRQFGMVAIGLRFFTVYGSWTRPDMAAYKFMQAIEEGNQVTLYNDGNIYRDFTHVSDIVSSIKLLIEKIKTEKTGSHQVFNIGYGNPISVKKYAELIAKNLDKPLKIESKPLPKNELTSTHSDTSKLSSYINYKPIYPIEEGVKEMTDWFRESPYETDSEQ